MKTTRKKGRYSARVREQSKGKEKMGKRGERKSKKGGVESEGERERGYGGEYKKWKSSY